MRFSADARLLARPTRTVSVGIRLPDPGSADIAVACPPEPSPTSSEVPEDDAVPGLRPFTAPRDHQRYPKFVPEPFSSVAETPTMSSRYSHHYTEFSREHA
jgi:hypothetical protein